MTIIVQLFLFVGVNTIAQNCDHPVLTIPSEEFPTNVLNNCSAITGVRNWTISKVNFSSEYEKTKPFDWMDIFREFSVDHQQAECLGILFNYSVKPDAAHGYLALYNFAFWCNAVKEFAILTTISPPLSRNILTIRTENDTFCTLLNMNCSLLQYLRFKVMFSSEIRIENIMKTAFALFEDSIPRVRNPSPCNCSKLLTLKKHMLECEQNNYKPKGIHLSTQEDKQIVVPHHSKLETIFLNLLMMVFSIAMILLIATIHIVTITCKMYCLKMENNRVEGI